MPVAWFVTTLYKANATAMPTELAMHIWMAFAMMSASFMLLYLRFKIPKEVCAKCCFIKDDFPSLINVTCAMQFVADVLATEMQLVYSYQRPVDKCFECFEGCHGK
jgi:hypothetical protein